MMRFPRSTVFLALALTTGACELAEVTTVPGEDVLVVEAVLRTDIDPQQVLLHRTLNGRSVEAVEGATVTITNEAGEARQLLQGGDCYRIDRRYFETDSIAFAGTCYSSAPLDQRWVQPGQTYQLLVETLQGEVVRGATTVPRQFALRRMPYDTRLQALGRATCSLPPGTRLPLEWTQAVGAWSYVAQLRVSGLRRALEPRGISAPEPLDLRGLAVSQTDTDIVLPSEFGVFERFELNQELLTAIQDGFPDNVQMELVVAAADRNWVNSVRGGSFNPSGQVRISSVVGDGIGVFGSLVPLRTVILVRSQSNAQPCGVEDL
jgi:hypothetical protein